MLWYKKRIQLLSDTEEYTKLFILHVVHSYNILDYTHSDIVEQILLNDMIQCHWIRITNRIVR